VIFMLIRKLHLFFFALISFKIITWL
jgi:hypothetical protein